jgi:hypothetical protein
MTAVLLTACSKNDTINDLNNGPQEASAAVTQSRIAANASILNKELKPGYARDGAVDITEDMNDWTFKFIGNYPGGEAQAWNDLLSVTGTWNMTEGSSTLSLSYPSTLSQMVYMSREWTVTGSGSEFILTAADGDEIRLVEKK